MTDADGAKQLLKAADDGDLTKVTQLLDAGVPVDTQDRSGWSLLHAAVARNRVDIAKLLLGRGATLDARTHFGGSTPLHIAADNGAEACVELFLDSVDDLDGPDPAVMNCPDGLGLTPLHSAAKGGHWSTIALLLKRGADVTLLDKCGNETVLLRAAEGGHLYTVKMLMEDPNGCDLLHIPNKYGHTPLFRAVERGHANLVTFLLDQGADFKSGLPSGGATPLHRAVNYGEYAVTAVLLGYGADANAIDNDNMSPVDIAAYSGHAKIISLLVKNGAKLGQLDGRTDRRTGTALHRAARQGHDEAVRVLLDLGADVNGRNLVQKTPLHEAAMCGRAAVVARLLQHPDVQTDAVESLGDTPLALATKFERTEVVELMQAHEEQ